jgi:hypothetical protein
MSNPSGPLSGTDLGPVPDGGSSSSRKVQPDNTDPPPDEHAENDEADSSPSPAPVVSAANGAAHQPVDPANPGAKEQSPPPPPAPPTRNGPAITGVWPTLDCSKSHQEMEATMFECMKTKYGSTLVTDMDDSQLLLSYVTRNALQEDRKVNADAIETLIVSREKMRAGTFDSTTEEAKFRAAYGAIAKAAQPVTVASLRDSTAVRLYRPWFRGDAVDSRPIAEIACLRYRNLAFLVLFALVAVQSYWTATSSVLSKTDALLVEINRAPTRQQYIAQDAELRGGSKGGSEEAAPSPGASPATSPPNAPGPDTTRSQIAPTVTNSTALTRNEYVSRVGELEANYSMLDKFMWPFGWLEYDREAAAAKETAKEAAKKAKEAIAPGPTASPSPATGDIPGKDPGKDPYDALFAPSKFQSQSAATRAVAVQVIDVMQKWLLPLLYGALGAMVFVVRTLSMQARDRLFRKEALVSLVLRVFLGMISGLAIGWFWTHDSSSAQTANGGPMALSTLSPFALAFVAGYGVELFFALLDKIVSTFTNK